MRLRWPPWRRSGEDGARFTRSGDAMSVAQSGRTVVLDLASEQYFALDDVGAAIWELLEGRPTVEDVARELAERYDAPYDAIRADTATFLEAMQRQGLVRGV